MAFNLNRSFMKMQFGFKKRMRIYRKLSKYLSNSFPLGQALDEMYIFAKESGRSAAVEATVLDEWRKSYANGRGIAPAMMDWVPNSERLIISGGEDAGKLAMALEKAIHVSSSAAKIRNTLIGGMLYPVLLFSLSIGFLWMFGSQVIPAFEEVLPRDKWIGVGAQMAVLSDFVMNWLRITLVALAVAFVGIAYSIPRWKKGLRVRFDRIPPWSLYRLVIGSGFMITLAGMLKSGISLPQALQTMARHASPWYRERILKTLFLVNNGKALGEALHLTGYQFPDRESVQDLRAYSKQANVEDALEITANDWLEESVISVQNQTALLRNLSFVMLALIFAWIASGIFSIQSQIANAV